MSKSSKSDEFFTFDEVLKELKLSEDELKKLVSEGEIRAFKDEDRMKFKKVDVENKRPEHITEPTVILPPDEAEIPATSNDATFIEEELKVYKLLDQISCETASKEKKPKKLPARKPRLNL